MGFLDAPEMPIFQRIEHGDQGKFATGFLLLSNLSFVLKIANSDFGGLGQCRVVCIALVSSTKSFRFC